MTDAVATAACSLYIHVPFCRSRCAYCDFHSAVLQGSGYCAGDMIRDAGTLRVESWAKAIKRHLEALELAPGWSPYATMYIGGGTPSALPPAALDDLLALLSSAWAGTLTAAATAGSTDFHTGTGPDYLPGSSPEWTVECNPDDLTNAMLDSFHISGVSRLSIGVQSLEDSVRRLVGRRGSAAEIMSALRNLAGSWKRNWSADFMYGMPGQSPAGLALDIRRIVDLGAGHISLYQLTLEEGTVLADEVLRGTVRLPDPDQSADQYSAAAEMLSSAGFIRYEVSNWALPGQECRHNLHYWRMDDWDAIGPSGVSNRRKDTVFVRGQNPSDDAAYEKDPPGSVTWTSVAGIDAMFECLMMALRTSEGFYLQRFQDIFGRDPVQLFGDLPATFPALVRMDSGRWRPTDEGMDMLNRVLVAALETAGHVKDSEAGGLPL